jgi:hypothetical protein
LLSMFGWRGSLYSPQELASRGSDGRDNVDGGGRSHVERWLREGREWKKERRSRGRS